MDINKGKQRWLCCDEDLHEMYSIYSCKKEILMWCFLPGKQSKRSQSRNQSGGSSAKRSKVVESNTKKVSEVQDIVTKLQSKHGTTYSPGQYHAWAQLIQMGKQTSQHTFFKVAPRKASSSATISGVVSTMNSPGKRVHLRTELFTQLEKLEGLFNPFTGVGAILRPVRVVCSKNHKKSPKRAMFFLNVPADAEKISLPRGIFCEVKKCRLLCSMSR